MDTFVPQEVAYRVQNLAGTAKWKRRICRTQKAFEKLIARINEQGGEVMTRDED